MRDRHELDGLGYRKIAREFNLALTTVTKICTYERRAQTAERWKTIKLRRSKPSPGHEMTAVFEMRALPSSPAHFATEPIEAA